MYNNFFSLQNNPFRMTPDPAFLYLTFQHREALAGLTYAIMDHKGFVVVIGDAGTGKTTLLARFLEAIPKHMLRPIVVLNPTLTGPEFLETLLLSLGVVEIPPTKPRRLVLLEKHLLESEKQGKICALLVDEAHKLSPEVLEEIRLIGNMQLGDRKLLQIVLLGQNDLGDILNRPDLRQLKQRVALRFKIEPLSRTDIGAYIKHRWEKAGGALPVPFTDDALLAIEECSGGIPRVINAVCDNALILACSGDEKIVTARHIRAACMDLDLPVRDSAPASEARTAAHPNAQNLGLEYKPHSDALHVTNGKNGGTSNGSVSLIEPLRVRQAQATAKLPFFRRLFPKKHHSGKVREVRS